MSNMDPLLTRNATFAASDVHHTPRSPVLPHKEPYAIARIDPRTDPADFVGFEFGEAIVPRSKLTWITCSPRCAPSRREPLFKVGRTVKHARDLRSSTNARAAPRDQAAGDPGRPLRRARRPRRGAGGPLADPTRA
jgi:hypothetical protein